MPVPTALANSPTSKSMTVVIIVLVIALSLGLIRTTLTSVTPILRHQTPTLLPPPLVLAASPKRRRRCGPGGGGIWRGPWRALLREVSRTRLLCVGESRIVMASVRNLCSVTNPAQEAPVWPASHPIFCALFVFRKGVGPNFVSSDLLRKTRFVWRVATCDM